MGRHVTIRCTTVLRDVARLNHTYVSVRWQADAEIHCRTQTEPGPQGPLLSQRPMQSRFAILLCHRQVSLFIAS